MDTPIEIINLSEIEVVEVFEDSMGLPFKGATTINLNDIWKVAKYKYKWEKEEWYWGTLIQFYEYDAIVVVDKYKDVEETRRKYKALQIELMKKHGLQE